MRKEMVTYGRSYFLPHNNMPTMYDGGHAIKKAFN